MTAQQLIERLQKYAPDTEMIIRDYHGTCSRAELDEQLALFAETYPDRVYTVVSKPHPFVIEGVTYYQ